MVLLETRSNISIRRDAAKNAVAKKIFQTMEEKQSNLALSCDVTTCEAALHLAKKVGPYISVLKTHIDIIEDFQADFLKELKAIAEKESFLIFEDRKFADIGNTVLHQYTKGMYKISSWADMVNAHALPGEGVLQGLRQGSKGYERGMLLLVQMSSKGSFRHADYVAYVEEMAMRNEDFVFGFIAQEKLFLDPKWIWMTPGVKLSKDGDELGQSYTTPRRAILEKGSDFIIVGRDIIHDDDPVEKARAYRNEAWTALIERD